MEAVSFFSNVPPGATCCLLSCSVGGGTRMVSLEGKPVGNTMKRSKDGLGGDISTTQVSENLIVSGGLSPDLHIFNVFTGDHRATLKAGQEQDGFVYSVVFLPLSQLLVSAGNSGRNIAVWSSQECQGEGRSSPEDSEAPFVPKCELSGHTKSVRLLDALKNEGSFVFSASSDQTVRLWDVSVGECIGVLEGHTGAVQSLCHDSERRIQFSGSNKHVFCWDRRQSNRKMAALGPFPGLIDYICAIDREKISFVLLAGGAKFV